MFGRGRVSISHRDSEEEGVAAQPVYTSVRAAMEDPILRRQILWKALAEFQAFKAKYEDLKEFAAIFEAGEAAQRKLRFVRSGAKA